MRNSRKGFSLFEVILAAALFAIVSLIFVSAFTESVNMRTFSGQQNRAALLAEEGLEAARTISENNFSSLQPGTWGFAIAGGHWTLTNASDTTGIFTRTLTISSLANNMKQVTVSVSWQTQADRTANVALVTDLLNFTVPVMNQAGYLTVNSTNSVIGGLLGQGLTGITLGNSGQSPISIIKVTVGWTNALASLQQIQIASATVWSGSGSSGSTFTIQTSTVAAAATGVPFTLTWNTPVAGNTFTITFTMADGSIKAVTPISL